MNEPMYDNPSGPRNGSPEVEDLDALAELALDLRSSWNHATDPVWRTLDPVLWDLTHNPWVVLQTISQNKRQQVLADPAFRKRVDELVQDRRGAARTPAWFQKAHAQSALTCVAYLSMEFMLSEALPIYSGGLGNAGVCRGAIWHTLRVIAQLH